LNSASKDRRTAADFLLSDALLPYLHHFRFGKYDPRRIGRGSVFVEKADSEGLKADMEHALVATPVADSSSPPRPSDARIGED
jgi:hypothetical protein